MILVTGPTSTVGRELIGMLQTESCSIRAVTRNPERVSLPEGVEVLAGDLGKPETLPTLLDGVEKVFLIVTHGVDTHLPRIALEAGVQHIVMLSSGSIGSATTEEEIDNAIARFHFAAEQEVRKSGIAWTFLRPSGFMSNTLQWAQSIRSKGTVRAPFSDVGIAYIDPRDIATVAVQAFMSLGHEGKIYTLTGPEKLTPIDQVRTLSDVIGRDLIFEEIPEDVARVNMMRYMPAEIVEAYFWRRTNHRMLDVLPTVKKITGRDPRTFKQWAIDHADAFL